MCTYVHVVGGMRCVYLCTHISYVSRYLGVSRYREAVCTYMLWEVEDLCITRTLYCACGCHCCCISVCVHGILCYVKYTLTLVCCIILISCVSISYFLCVCIIFSSCVLRYSVLQ